MNSARGALKPLLRLMGKMRFGNDFDAYGTLMQFVSRRRLRRGGYMPLVLYGPPGCGKTRMSTTIRMVPGIENPWCDVFWQGNAPVSELENALRSNGGTVVIRDVYGRAAALRNWLLMRYERRLSTDLIIETSNPDTFHSIGRLDFCDSVVFEGLPTDAGKGGV